MSGLCSWMHRFGRSRAWGLAIGVAFGVGHGGVAQGEGALFSVPQEGPLPASAHSVVVDDHEGVNIVAAPAGDAELVGHTLPHASFPVFETRAAGRGCRRLWLRIGPDAWICGERGDLSRTAVPYVERQSLRPEELPWSYAFTARDGVRAYHTLDAALAGADDPDAFESWEANWGVAIENATVSAGGMDRIVRTRSGSFVRRRDLYRASPTDFAGGAFSALAGHEPGVPFGWIAEGAAFVYARPDERSPAEPIARLTRVHVYATQSGHGGREFARIGPARWVRADKVRWIAPSPPPAGVNVSAGERWIDVDLVTQTLIAYEGAEPVYATLVSSGGARYPTPEGVFRVWGRYLAHTMDNTESVHLVNHFRLGDVPYVQFFDGDRALHAVYWHDHFGIARSHGCINLSPADAAFLFDFSAYPLPGGWASRAMPAGRGTVVRVRGHYDFGSES